MIKTAYVRFDGSRFYAYKTYMVDLIPGNYVVVETTYGTKVAIFVKYDAIDDYKVSELKFIIAKCDTVWVDYAQIDTSVRQYSGWCRTCNTKIDSITIESQLIVTNIRCPVCTCEMDINRIDKND